jgi:hypothetical protein
MNTTKQNTSVDRENNGTQTQDKELLNKKIKPILPYFVQVHIESLKKQK